MHAARWDARTYHDAAEAQRAWGRALLDRHPWRGDEIVLDAGCGTGGLIAEVLRRAPRGRVIAVDSDPGMIAEARRNSAGYGGQVRCLEADLQSLPDVGSVDVVFSNAVLHWVPDHAAVFAGFWGLLRPGGALLAQWGGVGNLRRTREVANAVKDEAPYAPYFVDWVPHWNFGAPEATRPLLEGLGFAVRVAELSEAPVTFADDAAWERFVRVVTLRSYVARLPEALQVPFVRAYMGRAAVVGLARRLDFVRMTVHAMRPDHSSGT